MTTGQNRRLYQLLNQTGQVHFKAELVASFTGGRSLSSKDLTPNEARELIAHLERQVVAEPKKPVEIPDSPSQRMRKKIFALCYQMGYIYGEKPEDKKMNQAIVLRMVERNGYLKPKPLNSYSESELVQLVSQFEAMQRNNNKQAARVLVRELVAEMNETESKSGFKSYLNND